MEADLLSQVVEDAGSVRHAGIGLATADRANQCRKLIVERRDLVVGCTQ